MNVEFYKNMFEDGEPVTGSDNVDVAASSFMKMVKRWDEKEILDAMTMTSKKYKIDWDELSDHIEKMIGKDDD